MCVCVRERERERGGGGGGVWGRLSDITTTSLIDNARGKKLSYANTAPTNA